MRLDSVRELKSALTQSVLAPLTLGASPRAMSLAAGPIGGRGAFRNIALGVVKRGPADFQLAVRLQRRELETGPHLDLIRKQAKGEVDVRYVGRIQKLAKAARSPTLSAAAVKSLKVSPAAVPWYQKRNRPLRIGSSIGHFKITAGTLGCFVKRRSNGEVLILSNNHVLANENNAKAGDAILQPGGYDGGTKAKDTIGKLADFVKLKAAAANLVDAAVASVKTGIKYNYKVLGDLGDLAGLGPAFLDVGTAVGKAGRTTGATHGKVTAFELDNVVVGYDIGNLRFDDQIEIEGAEDNEPFCRGGDSGSLIVDADNKAVALLFAGGDSGGSNGLGLTYGNPIQKVLDLLKVDLLY